MTSLDKVKAFFAIGTQKTVEVEQCDAS
jgi:hypothetical protein